MKIVVNNNISMLAIAVTMSLNAGHLWAKETSETNSQTSTLEAMTDQTIAPARKDLLPICDPDALDCDDSFPPPEVVPTFNSEFDVYRIGSEPSIKLSWEPATAGNTTFIRYEVYEEKEGQSPQQIYSRYNSSFTYTPTGNSTASYSVRACTSAGCSGFLKSPVFSLNPQPSAEDTVTLPVEYIRGNTNPIARTQGETVAAMAVLGNGFDTVKDEAHGNHCWDTLYEEKIASIEPVNEGFFDYAQTSDYETIREVFGRNTAYGVSLSYGGFTAGASGTSGVVSETTRASVATVIAAQYRFEQNRFNAKLATQLGLSAAQAQKLYDGEKFRFRTECGDKYIDSVVTGVKMDFTIRMENTDISNTDVRSTTADIGIALRDILNDGIVSHEEVDYVRRTWGQYKFNIILNHVGFTTNDNGALVQFNDIIAFLNEFSTLLNRDPANAVVISSTQRFYPIPDGLGDDRYSVFVDPTAYGQRLNNWALLDSQLENRCFMIHEGNEDLDPIGYSERLDLVRSINSDIQRQLPWIADQRQACSAAKDLYNRYMEFCSDQGKWNECYAATHSACIDNNIDGQACMARPDRVYAKYDREVTRNLTVSKKNCIIGPCERSGSVDICFDDAITVPNYWKAGVDGSAVNYWPEIEKSATVFVLDATGRNVEPKNLMRRLDGKYCLNSWAKVRAGGLFGDARYSADSTAHGFYIIEQDYNL